jgi:hypothetical protein
VAIRANNQVEQKRTEAQQKCSIATPVGITSTNGTSITVQDVAGISGRIIFAALDAGSSVYQLHALSSDSQLTTIEMGGSQPAYQRTAGIVAYTLGGTIHGLYSNGAVSAIGNGGGAWPSVSPDGTRVAYAAYQDGNWIIYIAPVNGSGPPVRLTQGTYPVWGPNGRIAFQACINNACGIHIINPDQPSDVEKLTTTASDINMQWSPDGSQLVYMTNFTGN